MAAMSFVETQRSSGRAGRRLALAALVIAPAGILLGLAAMMALFLGAQGPGVQALLGLLGWLLLPGVLLGLACLRQLGAGQEGALNACWARLPAWLLVLVSLLLLVALLAELAIWLAEFAGGGTVSGWHYLPIASVFVFSMALTTAYAVVAPAGGGGEHRGPVRHADPMRRSHRR